MDDERFATLRARLISRTNPELREKEAQAVAYSELGYSVNGISTEMDTTTSTVKQYLEKAMALCGMDITLTIDPDGELPEYKRVEPGYHRTIDGEERDEWLKLIERHSSKLPKEWVNSVLDEAREDGLSVVTN